MTSMPFRDDGSLILEFTKVWWRRMTKMIWCCVGAGAFGTELIAGIGLTDPAPTGQGYKAGYLCLSDDEIACHDCNNNISELEQG